MTDTSRFLPGRNEAIALDQRALIKVASEGDGAARTFLQGLVSCDMAEITRSQAGFGALLTPQGKILVDFLIIQTGEDEFLLDCSKAQVANLFKRLKMFRLRAPIALDDLSETHRALLISPADKSVADPRHAGLGHRYYGPKADIDAFIRDENITLLPAEQYQSLMIMAGIGEIDCGFGPEQMFLMDANYDRLNGVSYSKGCFVGQEVTSRMKRKGNVRKRTLRLTNLTKPVSVGVNVSIETASVGSVLASGANGALALIRVDRLPSGSFGESGLRVSIGSGENGGGENASQGNLETPDYLV